MTGAAARINCTPSIQRRTKRSMPTSIFDRRRGRMPTPVVRLGSEHFRIKSVRAMAAFERLAAPYAVLLCARSPWLRRLAAAGPARPAESYAIAMHGAPALPADFTHMPYANPDAPKGGRLVWGVLGTFDSLNPLIVRGLAVQQIRGFVVESLMARGNDEAFTLYGLLAKKRRDRRRQELRHLPSRSPRALLRRQAGHGRGRAVLLGAAARQGPPQPSPVLFQSRKGRGARPAHGAVRPRRRQRPRTAADPRPDAGLAEACRRSPQPSRKPR